MMSQKCYVISILCIHLFISNISVLYSFSNATKLEKNDRIINNCKSWQFQCKNGQCIAKPFVCDGLKDCKDYSDETYDQCRNKTSMKCTTDQFQCQYGACIEKKYRCDGLKQCLDGSDESLEICNMPREQLNTKRTRRQADKSCAVPAPSADKTIDYLCSKNPSGNCGQVNASVPELTIATVTCAPGYYRDSSEIGPAHACYNSQWSPKIGKCVKKCDDLNPVNVVFHCSRNGLNIENCNASTVLLTGTKIRPTCKLAYRYDFTPNYFEIKCNEDGKWDHNLFSCVPECGKPYTQAQLTIAGGSPESIGGSPWHVAIFNQDKLLICGGTIISESLVLSAAHCFSEGNTCEGTDCVNDFEVVIGKYTNNYSVKDNSQQRTMKIKEIRFPKKGYRGLATYYAADIAILILEEKVPISPAILPVCMHWIDLKNGKYPSEGEPGKVVGWGRTENGTLSTILRTINLPFIGYQRCVDSVDSDFKPFITLDKFCAGTGNRTGATLMDGDSGGGLLFEERSLFYLRGIVSVKSYSSNSVNVFTDLSDHIDWIASTRDEIEKKVQKFGIHSTNGGNYPTVYQPYNDEEVKKKIREDILKDIKSQETASASQALQQGITDTFKNAMNKLYDDEISNFELLLRFVDSVQDYNQKLKLYDALHNKIKSNGHQTALRLHLLRNSVKKEILDHNSGVTAAQSLYDTLWSEIKETAAELISCAFQNDTSWSTVKQLSAEIEDSCNQCTADIYNKVVETVWNSVNIPDLLQKGRNNLKYIGEIISLHTAIINKLKNTNSFTVCVTTEIAHFMKEVMDYSNYKNVAQNKRTDYEEVYNNTVKMRIRKLASEPISNAFQTDTSWPTAIQLSIDLENNCKQGIIDVYNDVVEILWNNITVPDLLQRARTNLKYLGEEMALHTAFINKLNHTNSLNICVASPLARSMKEVMDYTNYKNVAQNRRTNYEVLYNNLKMKIQETVGPISSAFQNDASWPEAKQLSGDIHDKCKQYFMDIYKEIVDTVWTKVSLPDILKRTRTNLKNILEDMMVHTVIINNLKNTDTLNASSAAALANAMKDEMDLFNYKNIPQANRTDYEELYNDMIKKIQEAVEPISFAFQNDTTWPSAKQLSSDIYDKCKSCIVNVYNKVVDNVWSKVTLASLLKRTRDNLENIAEDMVVHTAIINKLKSTGTLNAGSAAALVCAMKEEMDMSKYKNIAQVNRTDYEALYTSMKNTICETAVGPISRAFEEDASWETAKQLGIDVADTCNQRTTDLYNEVIDTVWGKVTVPNLLKRARTNLHYIREDMAIHTAIINKLKRTGSLTTSVAATIACSMKEEMDMSGYKNIAQDARTNYEILYVQMMMYDHSAGNFEPMLSFADSTKDYEHKYMLYHTLHEEMKNTDDQTAWRLHQLRKSVKKEILDLTTGAIATQMLYDKLWKEILETADKLISSAFISDTLWSNVKELGGYIHDNCNRCMIDIYKNVVEAVWNRISLSDLLKRTRSNLKYIEEIMVAHEAVINKLKQTNTLTASSAASLADSMKEIIDMAPYKNVALNKRSTYETLYASIKDFKNS